MKKLQINDIIIAKKYTGENTKEFKVWWVSDKKCEAKQLGTTGKEINLKFERDIKSDGKIIPYPKSAFLNWLNYTFTLKQ